MTDINPAASARGRARAEYHKCAHCDGDFRAKDIRHHKARCEKNPLMFRRIRDELAK